MRLESSGFQKVERREVTQLETWNQSNSAGIGSQRVDSLSISEAGSTQTSIDYSFLSAEELEALEKEKEEELLDIEDRLKISLIEAFIRSLTGKHYKLNRVSFGILEESREKINAKLRQIDRDLRNVANYTGKFDTLNNAQLNRNASGNQNVQRSGWGIRYYHSVEEEKHQQMDFAAKGTVKLENGREIEIDYHLHMSESSYKRATETFLAGDALIDPIVINYSGKSSGLTQEKYAFDIDMDGEKDQISFAAQGAGFLALDRNNNGTIDDGSELFGPSTNDGFGELSAYDEDGNGWIDENDAVFNQLRIWERNPDGTSKLMALGEVGIGAIYLKNATTLFDFSDDLLNLQGQMRASSIFLREDGTAGSVHEVDLKI
ncbi:MAG: hypothetical protein JXO44_03115 [Clostridia bacterium]|nr:hypothetical protein [Clostridia bacterium]